MAEMQSASFDDQRWPALLAALPATLDLDETARASGALVRRRAIGDAAALLRLALGYGPGGLSLRGTAAWATLSGLASLSDVAVLKRLRGAADWLGQIAGAVLTARAGFATAPERHGRIRLVDATTICPPRTNRTMWRLHASYDPEQARFTDLQLTDQSSGEDFGRFAVEPGDLVMGDRGYARGRGLRHVVEQGGDFVVRSGWRTQKLWTSDGRERFDLFAAVADLPESSIVDCDVVADQRPNVDPVPIRFIALRLSADAARQSQQRTHKRAVKRGRKPYSKTFAAAGYLFLLTSLDRNEYPPERVLALYRLRWQVELAFKRLKSLLRLDRLPAKDRQLARSWLYAHVIAALLIDDMTQDLLDSFPCANRNSAASRITVAHLQGARRGCGQRNPRCDRTRRPSGAGQPHCPPHLRSAPKAAAADARPRLDLGPLS